MFDIVVVLLKKTSEVVLTDWGQQQQGTKWTDILPLKHEFLMSPSPVSEIVSC